MRMESKEEQPIKASQGLEYEGVKMIKERDAIIVSDKKVDFPF